MSTNDSNLGPDRLSPNAKKILELRDEVLAEWEKRLRATVKEAERLPHPILINTVPVLYENLAEAISNDYLAAAVGGTSTVAAEHGGERARLTNYNAQAVVSEYQLLRWTIFDVLKVHGVQLTSDEFSIINTFIDASIRESVSTFALGQSALRERFVAALTHDLRNPLAAANMAAELIQYSAGLPEVKELAGRIIENLTRMDGMIQDLLDAVVFQAGERLRLHFEHFDIMNVAGEVRDQFTSIHGPRFQLTGETVNGYWDRNALKRAIENLVGNAAKYGASNSPIRIKISALHGRMIVDVHNEGEPIPPEQVAFVFQVFRRAASVIEGRHQGWGIGLPYVRSVAESHGGSVAIDSAPGRGTTFTIDLPVDSRPFKDAPTLA